MNTLPHDAHEGNSSFVIIPLTKGYIAIVDPEDADLAQLKWHVRGTERNQYATRYPTSNSRQIERMHRTILERKLGHPIQLGMIADHINGDTFDNRRANLREVTPAQNQYNKRGASYAGYKGAIFDRSRRNQPKPWVSRLSINGKKYCLGMFATPEEAARAYDRAAIHFHGQYAHLNFPIEEYDIRECEEQSIRFYVSTPKTVRHLEQVREAMSQEPGCTILRIAELTGIHRVTVSKYKRMIERGEC